MKSSRYILLLLLSSILILSGCGRRNVVRRQMDIAEKQMASHPDSALAVLNLIDSKSLRGSEDKARFALLMSMALDKNYVDTTTFDILQPAIDYYLKKGNPDEKLKTYYYQGRVYQNRENNDSAMQCFMRGREFGKQAEDTMTMANLLVAQGSILYTIYKYDDFIKVNLEAADLYNKVNRPDYEILSLANVLDGSILLDNKNLADSILKVTQDKIKDNPEFDFNLTPYLLSYLVKFGNKKEVEKTLKHYNNTDSIDDWTKVSVAFAYSRVGAPQEAKRFLDAVPASSDVTSALKFLAVRSEVSEKTGDFANALKANSDYYIILDSIHKNIFDHDLLFVKERYELEKENLLKIQQKDKILRISLCAAFVLLLIAGYIYYRYRMGRASGLLREQENERLLLEQENLRLKIAQLESESASLKEILEKQNDLAKPIEDAIRVRIEMLNGLLATQISENDSYARPYGEWRDRLIQDRDEFLNTTRLAFKVSHPKFIEFLEAHDLTESEINYLCLYAIGLKGTEIGKYMQLKRHYHISTEVRRKLGIEVQKTNIGNYIRTLLRDS